MKRYAISLIIISLLFVHSCSNTKVTSSWKSADVLSKPYKHIIVMGILAQKDRDLRDLMEHYFVDELMNLGYAAQSALDVYGPKAFDKMEESAIVEKIKRNGADAVITIVLLDQSKEERFVPGAIFYTPMIGTYYNNFGLYYFTIFDRIAAPGYYSTYTKYFWESNLYDVASNELVYSVQTKSFDPSSSKSLANQNSKIIIKDMVREGVLTNKRIRR